ncbi:carboxypeptidase regulatory-like domain-containing protein [Candidatus Woesearchaeota archaeon]|nr:carboxypeptidase regulatory-like domain-containing protein [Candidatus Woesearchaeota archaeon]
MKNTLLAVVVLVLAITMVPSAFAVTGHARIFSPSGQSMGGCFVECGTNNYQCSFTVDVLCPEAGNYIAASNCPEGYACNQQGCVVYNCPCVNALLVDGTFRCPVPKTCSASGAQDADISSGGNSIDDYYCTENVHDNVRVLSGYATVTQPCASPPSYWEPESCGGDGGESRLIGEKQVYVDDLNKYVIRLRVAIDDYVDRITINGNVLNRPDIPQACCTGYSGWKDVTALFRTGWNDLGFESVDTCGSDAWGGCGGRLFDIDWDLIPKTCADTDGSPVNYLLAGTVSGFNGYANYAIADTCSGNVLTEHGCAGAFYNVTASKNCGDYDTAATGDVSDSPDTTGICISGSAGYCGLARCGINASNTFAEGLSGMCGIARNSCGYVEYVGADLDGNGVVESCTPKVYDADTNMNTCVSLGLSWTRSGEGWRFDYDDDDDKQPGEFTGFNASYKCCGDDNNESARFRQGLSNDINDKVCCNTERNCVFNGKCFNNIADFAARRNLPRDMVKERLDRDRVYQDINGDGRMEVCVAASPGIWVSPTGSVSGIVTNTSGAPVAGAEVRVVGTINVTFTAADGSYSIAGVSSGLQDMIASKSPYSPSVQKDVPVPDFGSATEDFVLGYGSDLCEEDCTFTSDETCHASCQGTNGCLFFDANAAGVCDAVHSGFRVDYSSTQEVQCCEGSPYVPVKIKATTKINATNVVRITRNVWYEGKLVKMVIDVFS